MIMEVKIYKAESDTGLANGMLTLFHNFASTA